MSIVNPSAELILNGINPKNEGRNRSNGCCAEIVDLLHGNGIQSHDIGLSQRYLNINEFLSCSGTLKNRKTFGLMKSFEF